MYAIVGDGVTNSTEAIKTLESLWDAAVDVQGKDFWLLFVNVADPTETMQTIWAWANKTGVYYEVVTDENRDLHPLLVKNENLHTYPRVADTLVTHIANVDDVVLLILGGIDIDPAT